MYLRLILPLSLFLLICPLTSAQTPDTVEAGRLWRASEALYRGKTGQFEQGLALARQSKDLFLAALGENHIRVGDAWEMMANHANFLPNEQSQDYYYNAYRVYKMNKGENHPDVITLKFNADVLWCFQGNYEKCLPLLRESLDRYERIPKLKAEYLAWAYQYYGGFSDDAGDPETAILYLNKAYQLYQQAEAHMASNIAQLQASMALIHQKQGNLEKALALHLSAFKDAVKSLPPTNPTIMEMQGNIAYAYADLGKPDSALLFFRPALKNYIKNLGADHAGLISFYRLEARIHQLQQQPALAWQAWDKALALRRVPGNETFHNLWFPLYQEIAGYYYRQKEYARAVSWCDSVILQSRFDFKKTTELQTTAISPGLAPALSLKIAALLRWLETEDTPARRATFQQAQKDLETCLNAWKNPGAEAVFDISMQREVLPPATEAALDFEYLTEKEVGRRFVRQYETAQFAKAEALTLGFQSNRVYHFEGLPDSVLQQEKQLKKSLAEFRAKMAEAEAKKDSARLQKIQIEQFETKRAFDHLQSGIKKQYPRFAELRSTSRQSSVAELQKKLLADPHSALLEYFVGERSLYIFRLTGQDSKSWRIFLPAGFDSLVFNFHRAVSDYNLLRQSPDLSKKLFVESASKLSELLLHEPLSDLPSGVSRLIIVPDGPLHYLAFEALFTEQEDGSKRIVEKMAWRDFPFLVKQYAVSYGYSTALLLEQNAPSANRGVKPFAGFAPRYELKNMRHNDTSANPALAMLVREGFYELPGAQAEVAAVAKLMGGEVFSNERASEAGFREHAGNYSVLHLAMHALIDDRNPLLSRLLFTKTVADSLSDNQLTCGEIYGLSLKAELAVLTACNSGSGKLSRGEGAISLARAFTFAGVKSTVMSLWQAPDAQTERLMVLFYENLKKGLSKDEALRQAKQACLHFGENPELGHPFFWAGCILNGNSQPLNLPDERWQVELITGLLLLVLVLIVAIFRYR